MAVGYIKIDRKILAWEWYHDANVFRLFMHLLLSANHVENKWQGHTIKRGQLITGLTKLSHSTGLSEMQLRTCFDKLKSTNEITVHVTNKFRLVTICKYDTYQSSIGDGNRQDSRQNNNRVTIGQQASNRQVTANNNDKNDKNDNNEIQYAYGSDNFKSVFEKWAKARKEKRKPLTPTVIEEQMIFLGKYPEDVAIQIIETSTMNGWTGLFPPRPITPQRSIHSNNVDSTGMCP